MWQALKQKVLKNKNETIENNKHMKINQSSIMRRLLVITGSLLAAGQIQADTLALWNMDATPNANKVIANTVASGLTAGNLIANNLNTPAGINLANDNPANAYIAWSINSSTGSTPNTLAAAIVAASYFSFTLTPNAGQSLDLTTLSFDAVAGTAGPSDRAFYVLSDKTGYTTSALLLSGDTTTGSPLIPYNTTTSDQLFSVDLSGNSLFQNISDSVTFRFYLRTPTVSQNLGFDNLTANGSVVPAPEPSVYALGGLGLMMLALGKKWCRTA
jgi:hypothetical protein